MELNFSSIPFGEFDSIVRDIAFKMGLTVSSDVYDDHKIYRPAFLLGLRLPFYRKMILSITRVINHDACVCSFYTDPEELEEGKYVDVALRKEYVDLIHRRLLGSQSLSQ